MRGFASKRLVDAVNAGDIWKASKRIHDGGRHRELWSFMKHRDLLYDFPHLKYDLEVSHVEMGHVKLEGRTILRLEPTVGYRTERARRAAIAILSLKRRGLISKDMSSLIAKMLFLSYENRYSEKWGRPANWKTPIYNGISFASRVYKKWVEFLPFLMFVAILTHFILKI
jgi:hypothetical protein